MDIEPRFDVYRSFDNPDEVMAVFCGVKNGQLRTIGVAVKPQAGEYCSNDEATVRKALEPMLREMWNDDGA